KGQWPDPAGSDPDVQRNFLAIVESLAGRASRAGVATHDPQLARAALAHLCATATACESELLYGLPARTPLEIAVAAGVPAPFDAVRGAREREPLVEAGARAFRRGMPRDLDFACGNGRIAHLLAPRAVQTYGVDLPETLLAQARAKCAGTTFLLRDLTRGPAG